MVDQFGRCSDPAYFAAGNLLRPVETAGWSFREGSGSAAASPTIWQGPLPRPSHRAARSTAAHGVKLVVPQRLALPLGRGGLRQLQLRVDRAVTGELDLPGRRRADLAPEHRGAAGAAPAGPAADIHLPPATRRLEIGFHA